MKLLLSHIADMDGVTPIILLNLLGIDFEYQLFEARDLSNFLQGKLDTDYFSSYDEVFITDIGMNRDTALKLSQSKYVSKFKLFDHHESNKFLNDYSFGTVIESIDNFNECGTTIFYKYLVSTYSNPILTKKSVIEFVELVRECDTWQFTDLKQESLDLNSLFSFFGRDYFVDYYTDVLKNKNDFYFSKMELSIISSLNRKQQEYLKNLEDKVIIKKIDNYNIGIVFAEQYRSLVGHYLAEKLYDKVDFIAIINMNYHVSFRGVKDIPINLFAEKRGGGGHPLACAMPLPDIKEKIIDLIFGEKDENR